MLEKVKENLYGENGIESDEYYIKHSAKESDEKVNMHLRVAPEIANGLTEIVAIYRKFGIDKKELSKSDLGAVILKEFFDNIDDDESAILDIFSKVKAFRDGGVADE